MNNLSIKALATKIDILKAKKAAGILSSEEAALLEKLEAQYTEELIQSLQAKQAAGILTLDEVALLEQLMSQYPEAITKKEEKHSGASKKEKDVEEVGVDTGIVDSFSASPALGGLAALGGAGAVVAVLRRQERPSLARLLMATFLTLVCFKTQMVTVFMRLESRLLSPTPLVNSLLPVI